MPSLISGFEYDIFISYRHKDNKGAHWVTGFVNALETELDSTFKEDISIYFDENPHDGLLETHNVDKSLERKLKSLIFIPILSQTYCDSKSFAWQHEFCEFNKLIKEDQFGRDIRLTNGNFASRILPVKIHDLDADDRTTIENELGGVLRAIEFIYKEPGVNRPLKANDEPSRNINHTYYHNQINKVANAVKEIITGLKNYQDDPGPSLKTKPKLFPGSNTVKPVLKRNLAIASLAVILVVIGYFIYSFTRPKAIPGATEKSIAVLPFRNIGQDEYFSDGMTEEIINHLAKVGELKVMSRTSIEQYKGQTKDARTIAEELSVSYILEGSVQRAGNTFRVTVKLIEAKTGFNVWSNSYDRELTDVLLVQSNISKAVTDALKIALTDSERKTLENPGTVELTAYDLYFQARSELMNFRLLDPLKGETHLNKAISLFEESIADDPRYAKAYSGLGLALTYRGNRGPYITSPEIDSAKMLADRSLEIDDQTDEGYYLRGLYYYNIGKTDEAILNFEKAIDITPNYVEATIRLGFIYMNTKQDYVTGISLMERAVQLGRGPELVRNLTNLAFAYHWIGLSNKSNELLSHAIRLDGDSTAFYLISYEVERMKQRYQSAYSFINKACRIDATYLANCTDTKAWLLSLMGRYQEALDLRLQEIGDFENEPLGANRIGYLYWKVGNKKKAQEHFERGIAGYQKAIDAKIPFLGYHYDMATILAFQGQKEKAYKYLDEVNKLTIVPHWLLVTLKDDQMFESIRDEDRFQRIVRDIENKFNAERDRVSQWLEKERMKGTITESKR